MDQFNTLTLRKYPKRLLTVIRQTLEAAGLTLPANADVSVVIQTAGDPVTGYPVRKVQMMVTIETPEDRIAPATVIPFLPHYSNRQQSWDKRRAPFWSD